MAESKNLADLVAASFEALDRHEAAREALDPGGDRPPAPGDVYVLGATQHFAVEWAVLAQDPADPSRCLVVPADGHVLAGSGDVELAEDSPVGALKLRCRFGAWIDAELLRPDLRVGRLAEEALVVARQKWLDLGDGEVTGDVLGHEVDDDPEYQDWVEDVLVPSRSALIEARSTEETPEQRETIAAPVTAEERRPARLSRRSSRSAFFRIAASIVVAVASVQIWRLSDRVDDLEMASRRAEERHGVAVRQLETERDRLEAERDRLQDRQQELESSGAENAAEARELRERVADLDRRLAAAERASEVVNPAIAIFSAPEEVQRGKEEVAIGPEQSSVLFFLPLREPSPAPRYRLEVRVRGTGEPVWSNDRLVVQETGEIRVGLPARLLKPGEYELELWALEGEEVRRVAGYDLIVSRSSEKP